MSPHALVALLAIAACADSYENSSQISQRTKGYLNNTEASTGCMYEGRWYGAGSAVRTREACLACVCAHGALSCRRRACAPLLEPPPRCHILHQKSECCPELRCPDGVKYLDHGPSARLDDSDIDIPSSIGHACVEGGTVYAAGSAMSSNTACEQCFCLGGARRCVRPLCLPPPPGCQARPTPGACCPQRYYCEHTVTKPPDERNPHDCITPEGKWAIEGQRVRSAETAAKCIQCFCLRGSIRCQHLSCAPTLQGCTPFVQPGQCCAHQYQCSYQKNVTKIPKLNLQRLNSLTPLREQDRSFHSSKSTKRETTIKEVTTDKSTSAVTVSKHEPITTMKVKRNTDENLISSSKSDTNVTVTLAVDQATQTFNDVTTISTAVYDSGEDLNEGITTEQPERSVKIIINGTINCTAELSSSSLILNVSNVDDAMWIESDIQPRIPLTDKIENEEHTNSPHDIITDRNYNSYDENETFNINVTSTLTTNTTRKTNKPTNSSTPRPKTVPPALLGAVNISKVKKEELDFDYTEPTLPPSLPNLKIIPFVAADAVVDEEVSSKEGIDYPILANDDKFPVYYPNKGLDQSSYPIRKEDVYNPTQYPVFVSQKIKPQYPSLTQEIDASIVPYSSLTDDEPAQIHEYTVTTSLGSASKVNHNIESKSPPSNNKFEIEAPTVNLFSPPMETEGGFIPKDPGIDEYYSIYQSTPAVPVIPHLTTSMQLEPKDACISSDGRHVSEGGSISLACSICTCAWGELHCSPRPCNTPPGCSRRTAIKSSSDLCCGELICESTNQTTVPPLISSQEFAITLNDSKIEDKDAILPNQQNIAILNSTMTTTHSSSENDKILIESINTGQKELLKGSEVNNSTHSISSVRPDLPEPVSTQLDAEQIENNNHPTDYDEESGDDGFSLSNVLQFLLSETYETTTSKPKPKTTKVTEVPPKYFTNPTLPPNRRKVTTLSDDAFVPVTHRFPIIPPKKIYPQNAVDRIDHLVLGESNAIRKTTLKPTTIPAFKPINYPTTRKSTASTTTQKPLTTKLVEITSKEGFVGQSVQVRPSAQNFLPGMNLGLPKLAGCNIYGRMYRVGRIIAELSSPCQECKCTEVGVQCRSLSC